MSPKVPIDITDNRLLSDETVPGGAVWSRVLRRHEVLRLIAKDGDANASLLLFNRDLLSERYNMADTLKAQHTAFLTQGHVLYSDMGRILCSVITDTCGWHDTVCGMSDSAIVREKYGESRYQEQRNAFHRNARDEFITELAKWGLGLRDLVPNLNAFSKAAPSSDGQLQFITGHCKPGACLELRAEMNVLVMMSTCQHPLDPNPSYAPRPIRALVYRGEPPAQDDVCRNSCPENARGFSNTEALFLGAD